MNQLNKFRKVDFNCDKCQRKFYQTTAYSPNSNLDQLEETYCVNCVDSNKPLPRPKKKWGSAPINEVSENLQSLNLDKRTLKKTGRIHLFATRMKKEWIEQLKNIAYEERLHYNELLEKALECYEKHRS